jgi:hypothetical protein
MVVYFSPVELAAILFAARKRIHEIDNGGALSIEENKKNQVFQYCEISIEVPYVKGFYTLII